MTRSVACVLACIGLAAVAQAQPDDAALIENVSARAFDDTLGAIQAGMWMQARYAASQRDTFSAASHRDTRGASIPKSRIWFQNTLPGPAGSGWRSGVRTRISGAFDSGTGDFNLHDATATFPVTNTISVTAGQFKPPWLLEESIEDNRQLFASHSPFNESFNQGLAQGVAMTITNDGLPQFIVSVTDGFGTGNTDFEGEFSDINLTGRVSAPIDSAGANVLWGDYFYVDPGQTLTYGFPGSEFQAIVGAAAMVQSGGDTANGVAAKTTDRTQTGFTIDALIGADGVVGQAAFVFVSTDVPVGRSNDFGIMGQVGYFIDDQWQLLGGVDVIFPDDNLVPGAEAFLTLRAGANFFILPNSNAGKITFQVNYFDDATTSPAIASIGGGNGVFGTGFGTEIPYISDAGSPQVLLIAQLQVEVR